MKKDQFFELLDRYLAGKSSEQENALLFELYEELENQCDFDVRGQLYEKQLEEDLVSRFKTASEQQIGYQAEKRQPVKLGLVYRLKPLLAAASILICLAIPTYFLFKNIKAGNTVSGGINPLVKTTVKPVASQTGRSLNEHRQIKLQDGSIVRLNKNSQLIYPKIFNGKTREVILTGEGYFDIKHDATKPFLVHAGGLTITVLGTAFNINTTGKVAVTVTRGKVSVSHKKILLGAVTPGQQISFDADKNSIKRITLDADKIVEWQANDLFFENTTMADAAVVLERRFHKKISFENEAVKSCVFTASFTHGQTLKEILKVISAFNNADFEEKSNQIIFKGKGC